MIELFQGTPFLSVRCIVLQKGYKNMKILKTITALSLALVIAATGFSTFSAKKLGAPKLTVKNTSKGVKASWSKTKGAVKYNLLYKKEGAKKYIKAYSGKKTSFTKKKLNSGVKYLFKVKAKTKKKTSAYSAPSKIPFLKTPTLKEAEEKLDMKGIYLSWSKVKGADGYRIYRSLKYKNSYKKVATVEKSVNVYLDETVKDEKNPTQINSYKYYIRAYKDDSSSAKSNVKSDVYGWIDKSKIESSRLYLTIKKGQEYKDIHKKLDSYHVVFLFTWKSSNKRIVTVDNMGVITGVKKGKATLTAKALVNNKERTVKIDVTVK